MLETDKVFAGSVPENYDRYMVPLIFKPFAADLAQRAASFSPSAVLETAAGTGVVTPALAPKLSPGASYIVTDLNQPMLAASRQAPDSRIKWRQADALALPFENAAFDLVCCQFGAMFFPCSRKDFSERSPRFLARTRHGYHDTALIRSELEDAGFSRVVFVNALVEVGDRSNARSLRRRVKTTFKFIRLKRLGH